MKNAVIIGNCQSAELGRILSMSCRDIVFHPFQVHLVGPNDIERLVNHLKDYHLILSMPLSEHFGPISREALKSVSDRVLFFTNVHFEGLHPDFTFIGTLNDRCVGPLGNYHSRIAFHAFLAGLNVAQTVTLFTGEVYDRLGYQQAFSQSENVFRNRDSNNDIAFSDAFFALAKRERALLTFNHPATASFVEQAQLILAFLEDRGLCSTRPVFSDPSVYENSLVAGPALPVYPELADRIGLLQKDGYVFKTAARADRPSVFIGLEQFIEEEFACFAQMPADWLRASPQAARQDQVAAIFREL